MTKKKIIEIFKDIHNTNYSDDEKTEAIDAVMGMETFNSISKSVIVQAFKWAIAWYIKRTEKGECSEWIPVSERLPVSDGFVLISFENATFVMIGRCDEHDDGSRSWHVGDEEQSCLEHDLFVNAWMLLPANYEGE